MTSDFQRDFHQMAAERQLGREQGEAFDRRLRERELAGREERLSRLVVGLDEPPCETELGPGRPLGVHDLQREVERLRAFYDAVQRSRAWRLTQRLRGFLGRAW
ncbi:MAG TPA: hypothetical protein VMW75_22460 [Thermoanaerobaculia bacterium]|nr:hypothetical protein [Thermoanaerobaculia bacterium]